MNKTITFNNFILKEGYIGLDFSRVDIDNSIILDEGSLYFELTPAILPRNELIAVALSTLCCQEYSKINLSLEVASHVIDEIRAFTKAKINCPVVKTVSQTPYERKNSVLNFSGGFDSMAAKLLMPGDTKLVALDFGGRFARERNFYKEFKPCIVRTNLTETSLRIIHWPYFFMGISSILFRDYLKVKYLTFGHILEATENNFLDEPLHPIGQSGNPFTTIRTVDAPYVLGMTEVGTLKVLVNLRPDMVEKSLQSLASPGEEKLYRKQLLVNIANDRFGFTLNSGLVEKPKKIHFTFGESFAPDFLIFYIIKFAGLSSASLLVKDIPDQVVHIAESLKLNFYDRINPKMLRFIPPVLRENYYRALLQAKIEPYSYDDWVEFSMVRNFLQQYYAICS